MDVATIQCKLNWNETRVDEHRKQGNSNANNNNSSSSSSSKNAKKRRDMKSSCLAIERANLLTIQAFICIRLTIISFKIRLEVLHN